MSDNFSQLLNDISKDEDRNERFLHLTPNEPAMSDTARQFLVSKLADRYYFGPGVDGVIDNGSFTALGLPGIGSMVRSAEDAAKKMLGAASVNLSCLSGVHAMMCVLLSVTKPGDTVMTLNHDHGGHFATKGILKRIGRNSVDTVYDYSAQKFNAQATAQAFRAAGAVALYMDVSYHTSPINIRDLRQAIGNDAIIIYDASHTVGLMMGGVMLSPLQEGANIVCANTHKTLPGPQKGMIAYRDQSLADTANATIDSCLYSSPHTGSMLALATTILEMQSYGHEYSRQIVANAQALGKALTDLGFSVRTNLDGTYSWTHQIHLLTKRGSHYRDIYDKLYRNSIAVAFDDPGILGNGTFIRLGTQEITRRGMNGADMRTVAGFIKRAIDGEDIHNEVEAFKKRFNFIHYSFDSQATY
jgi:glycine/serine hydroxymethyltransferase